MVISKYVAYKAATCFLHLLTNSQSGINYNYVMSCVVLFNYVVYRVQEDERFLNELFVHLGSEEVNIDKRRDLILFLKEFCTFSQTLQPPNRENFYKVNH